MVLGLGEHDAFAGDQLGGADRPPRKRHLHRDHQRLAVVLHDLAAGRHLAGIEPQRLAGRGQDLDVVLGLLEILLPFLAQVVVEDALERGLVDEHAALLVLQRLQQKLFQLWRIMVVSWFWVCSNTGRIGLALEVPMLRDCLDEGLQVLRPPSTCGNRTRDPAP